MKLCELVNVIFTPACVKIVGFEYFDSEEYEIFRNDGKYPIPDTFGLFDVVELDTETDNGETYLKIRVDTNSSRINQVIFSAYCKGEFRKAEIRDQDGDLVDSIDIPDLIRADDPFMFLDVLSRVQVFRTGFETVRSTGFGTLEFTIYREED